jgi:hypothetical protein
MESHGERFKKYVKTNGLKHAVVAGKLGIHVNTLRNWFAMPTFSLDMVGRLAAVFPGVRALYPDVRSLDNEAQPTVVSNEVLESTTTKEQLENQVQFYQERYIKSLKRYNELLEKHIELQDRLLSAKRSA